MADVGGPQRTRASDSLQAEISDEERVVVEETRRIIDDEIRPYEHEIEATGVIPRACFERLASAGFLALRTPEQFGGRGLSIPQYLLAMKEISKVHSAVRLTCHPPSGILGELLEGATDEQRGEILPKLASGEWEGAFALTEPEAGADSSNIETAFRQEGDEYVINGMKWLITNPAAEIMFVVARREGAPPGALTMLLVRKGNPGYKVEDMGDTLGARIPSHGRVWFENCRVPVSDRIGSEGAAMDLTRGSLTLSRLAIGAIAMGSAEHCFDLAVNRLHERSVFGKPLAQRQGHRWHTAEIATEIYSGNATLMQAARRAEHAGGALGMRNLDLDGAIVKLLCGNTVVEVADWAMAVYGGLGYTSEVEIERWVRDVRLNRIEEGTPEVQKMVISRLLLGKPDVRGD